MMRRLRHWWIAAPALIAPLMPPIASRGYDPLTEWLNVSMQPFAHPLMRAGAAAPWLKVLPLLLVVIAAAWPRPGGRALNAYAAALYALITVNTSLAVNTVYGVVVNTCDLLLFTPVTIAWTMQAITPRNNYRPLRHQTWWRYWVVALALLALWYPLNPATVLPDFNPYLALNNGAGIAFCTITPLFIVVLLLCHPHVHLMTLRVTCVAAVIAALCNVVLTPWWNGVLHLPLLVLGLYGVVLAVRRDQREKDS